MKIEKVINTVGIIGIIIIILSLISIGTKSDLFAKIYIIGCFSFFISIPIMFTILMIKTERDLNKKL
jgi:hypothetical protein